jgi:hypothetical protein
MLSFEAQMVFQRYLCATKGQYAREREQRALGSV